MTDPLPLLREALAAVAKATPGPWRVETDAGVTMTTGAANEDVCDNTTYYPVAVKPADQRAIVAAVNFLRTHGDALLARLAGEGWQPIETCPDQLGPVLVANRDGGVVVYNARVVHGLLDAARMDNEPCWYTHWMPLPAPPALAPAPKENGNG